MTSFPAGYNLSHNMSPALVMATAGDWMFASYPTTWLDRTMLPSIQVFDLSGGIAVQTATFMSNANCPCDIGVLMAAAVSPTAGPYLATTRGQSTILFLRPQTTEPLRGQLLEHAVVNIATLVPTEGFTTSTYVIAVQASGPYTAILAVSKGASLQAIVGPVTATGVNMTTATVPAQMPSTPGVFFDLSVGALDSGGLIAVTSTLDRMGYIQAFGPVAALGGWQPLRSPLSDDAGFGQAVSVSDQGGYVAVAADRYVCAYRWTGSSVSAPLTFPSYVHSGTLSVEWVGEGPDIVGGSQGKTKVSAARATDVTCSMQQDELTFVGHRRPGAGRFHRGGFHRLCTQGSPGDHPALRHG